MFCYGLFGRWEMTLLLTRDFHHFAGYFFGYLLDPYVVNLTTAGGPPRYGYWVHTVDNDSTGFVQPICLAV
jgi:hypothetical protein